MKRVFLLLALLVLLTGTYLPLTRLRATQPPEVRLGFYPPAPVIKALSADQYHFISQVILLNNIFYYGTMVEREEPVNIERMYEALQTSARLDPYNMDSYYMVQGILIWNNGMVSPSIELLEYGFSHRRWDWYLPFFLSFDYAYFRRDYKRAGEYMAKAAALNQKTGFFYTLAARYFYEGGRTALALAYLNQLIPETRNKAMRARMITRAQALEGILALEKAVSAFEDKNHRLPKDLAELQRTGFIQQMPVDPYGGIFYLDNRGRVRTSSKLAKPKKGKKKRSKEADK